MNREKQLTGKVALVTGASRGLGRAIALALGKAGAAVAVTDLLMEGETCDPNVLEKFGILAGHFSQSGEVKTRATAQEIQSMGSKSCALKMDVSDADEVMRIIHDVENELGQVDILINNAAIMDNFGEIDKQNLEHWERDLRVNLTGAFTCIKAVWPGMVRKGWGRIINISSAAALMGAWLQPSYGATKAGLIGLTKSMAIEGGRHNITVNAICPGFIETEAVKLYDVDMRERVRRRSVLRRLGRPEEVAQTVVFLVSESASYITGAVIPVMGGADLLLL